MRIARTKIIYNRDVEEYRVKAYGSAGQRMPNADYFTDDKADAKATALAMVNPELMNTPEYRGGVAK
ncbi:MAG TPA: hypothetical protein VGG64_22340 [Pirellulales bacterium]|jgi:hypothetical protein